MGNIKEVKHLGTVISINAITLSESITNFMFISILFDAGGLSRGSYTLPSEIVRLSSVGLQVDYNWGGTIISNSLKFNSDISCNLTATEGTNLRAIIYGIGRK